MAPTGPVGGGRRTARAIANASPAAIGNAMSRRGPASDGNRVGLGWRVLYVEAKTQNQSAPPTVIPAGTSARQETRSLQSGSYIWVMRDHAAKRFGAGDIRFGSGYALPQSAYSWMVAWILGI